jgi:4a-hydroxytetrahydrobiopterin dehydratase
MRARWGSTPDAEYLEDALTLLAGWTRNGCELSRTLPLDESQHAALTERIKVACDTMQVRPHIQRSDGQTRIRLGDSGDPTLTAREVTLAARIEAAYRTVTGLA